MSYNFIIGMMTDVYSVTSFIWLLIYKLCVIVIAISIVLYVFAYTLDFLLTIIYSPYRGWGFSSLFPMYGWFVPSIAKLDGVKYRTLFSMDGLGVSTCMITHVTWSPCVKPHKDAILMGKLESCDYSISFGTSVIFSEHDTPKYSAESTGVHDFYYTTNCRLFNENTRYPSIVRSLSWSDSMFLEDFEPYLILQILTPWTARRLQRRYRASNLLKTSGRVNPTLTYRKTC